MKLSETIREGKLIFDSGIEFNIQCGYVENYDGVFIVKTYYTKENGIWDIVKNGNESEFFKRYSIKGLDEELHKIHFTELVLKQISFHQHFIYFYCKGFFRHNDRSGHIKTSYTLNKDGSKSKPKVIDNSVLWYLELENLQMDFDILADRSLHKKHFSNLNIASLKKIYRSEVNLPMLKIDEYHYINEMKLTFQEGTNNNVVISFDRTDDNKKRLKEHEYRIFKNDLISYLSFLNGARIHVRREYVGSLSPSVISNFAKSSNQTNNIKSSEIVTYFYKLSESTAKNNYIPLQHSQTSKILESSFICFNNFVEKNEIFDFTSIIYILNGNNDTASLENRFYSLITAFERISHKYSLFDEVERQYIIPDNIYDLFKNDLIATLDKNKSKFHKSHPNGYSALKSKLTEFNIRKRTETTSKFYHILEKLKIQVTPEIENIIQNIRHTSVHQGNFGEGKDAYKNYFVLDKLIRDIILKLIGYEGVLNESEYHI